MAVVSCDSQLLGLDGDVSRNDDQGLLVCRLRVGVSDFGCSGSRDVLAVRQILVADLALGQFTRVRVRENTNDGS
jgi:hypothetical protein